MSQIGKEGGRKRGGMKRITALRMKEAKKGDYRVVK